MDDAGVPHQLVLFAPGMAEEAAPPTDAESAVRVASSLGESLGNLPGILHQRLDTLLAPSRRLAHLTLTDNRNTILSLPRHRAKGSEISLRLHWSFVHAGEEVLRAVAYWVGGGRTERQTALRIVRRYFEARRPSALRVKPRLHVQGEVYDLAEIRDQVRAEYFAGDRVPEITWGRWGRPGRKHARRRSLRLGSFDGEHGVIRIHPVLDCRWVPRQVVASVIYHEMLHAVLPATRCSGRRTLHDAEFRRRESLFAARVAVDAWVEENLPRLLRRRQQRRKGR